MPRITPTFTPKRIFCALPSILFLFFVPIDAASQQRTPSTDSSSGTLTGVVRDMETNETIIGANVLLSETGRGAATDIDGAFSIPALEPGLYTISVSYISYTTRTLDPVEIKPGETLHLDIKLQSEAVDFDEIIVTADADASGEAGRLAIQRKAVSMGDGLSSRMISKIGDDHAASALKRVTGVSLLNGKDVYIRGLGNRYSNIQLNNSPIPSTSSTKKEAPVDLLSSGWIDHIVVQKTYTADQPGEFSGGAVRIQTREFPDENRFSLGYSTGYNSTTTAFGKTLGYKGSSTDLFGFDNGQRSLPDLLQDERLNSSNKSEAARLLNNNWSIGQTRSVIPSQKVDLTYSRQLDVGVPAGLVSGLTYRYKRSYQPEQETRVIQSTNDQTSQSLLNGEYLSAEGVEESGLSGMLNLFLKPSSNTRVGVKNLYSNDLNNSSRVITGSYINYSEPVRQTVADFDRRSIYSTSLIAETMVPEWNDSRFSVNVTLSGAHRNRPDRRTTQYNGTSSGEYHIYFDDNGNSRFYSRQIDQNLSAQLDYEVLPFDFLTVKAGGRFLSKERDFTARRFEYQDFTNRYPSSLRTSEPEQALHPDLIVDGSLELVETTQSRDSYRGDQQLSAAYISTTLRPHQQLTLDLGLRLENSNQIVTALDRNQARTQISNVDATDLLPAVNLTYHIDSRSNARAAWSTTLARPEFREISNFRFQDYLGSRIIYGNPSLQRTKIKNYDFRIETYPNPGEVFALSLFYKKFSNPVELYYRFTERTEVQYRNSDEASLYGIELEGRKNLLPSLQITFNGSYILSETVVHEDDRYRVANRRRPMYGQSPYTFNTGLFYNFGENLDLSLSLNTFGARIVTIGMNRHGDDEYEQPFHSLDAGLTWRQGPWTLRAGLENLLNNAIEYKQSGVVTHRVSPGMNMSAGVRYNF